MGWAMPPRFLLLPTPTPDAIKRRLIQRKRGEEKARREGTCRETSPRESLHFDISSSAAAKQKEVTGGKVTPAEETGRAQPSPEEMEDTSPLVYSLRRQKKAKSCARSNDSRMEKTPKDAEHLEAPLGTLRLPPLVTTGLPKPREKRPAFHHLRLLTPGTRANKTLYQTWHGRPVHADHHTSYHWSMFTTSRGHALEYLIHPDWH
nr:uncharacterized protein LOC117350656 isoform X2 [Geotrypetes seraphini]